MNVPRDDSIGSGAAASTAAFTLLELMVVLGLVAALSFGLMSGLRGGKTVALQSVQRLVESSVETARTRAIADGGTVRLLVNQSASDSSRYLRYLILQERLADDAPWQIVSDAYLPAEVRVVPAAGNLTAGLLAEPDQWSVASGNFGSTALVTLAEPVAVSPLPADAWSCLQFNAAGVPNPSGGNIVLSVVRMLPPGQESPVQFFNSQDIRGVKLSRYGIALELGDRSEL